MSDTASVSSATAGDARKATHGKGRCEYKYKSKVRVGERCTRYAKYWVQRGQFSQLVCPGHLAPAVESFWSLASGWHGKSEYYEGYLLTDRDRVIVRMTRSGEAWV